MIKSKFLSLALVAALWRRPPAAALATALGDNKNAPDEFAIATKAPLVVPPDYALIPPKPGESRPQELSPSERAREVLLGRSERRAADARGAAISCARPAPQCSDSSIRNILNAEKAARAVRKTAPSPIS